MQLTDRNEYILGGIVKSVKKAVKGVAGGIKDIISSDVGKLALLAAGGAYLGGLGGGVGLGRFAPSAMKAGLLGTVEAGTGLYGGGVLSGLMNTGVGQAATGMLSKGVLGKGAKLLGGSALITSLFGSPQAAQEMYQRNPATVKNYIAQYYKNINPDATDEEVEEFASSQLGEYAAKQDLANGGRVGFEEGGMGNNMEDLPRGLQIDTTTYSLGEDPQFEKITIPREKPIQKYLLNEVMSERGMNTLSEDTREMFMKELAVKAFKKGQISREEYNEIMGIEGKKDGGIMNIPMGEPRENQQGVKELDYRKEGGFVPV